MNIIEFSKFTCYYRQKKDLLPALYGINLSIENGTFTAIVGESGSGKSTLLKACLGIAEYFDGELFIDGIPIDEIDVAKKNYAYVSQNISLLPHLTVYENIAFPLRVCRTPQKVVDNRVKAIAKELGIELLLTRKPKQLSVGQQQRVALGRSLVKNPEMLFIDEPFANLDPSLHRELGRMIKAYHEKYRPTILFVTHDLQEAFALGERIVVLEHGMIAETGTPQELYLNPTSELIRGYVSQGNMPL